MPERPGFGEKDSFFRKGDFVVVASGRLRGHCGIVDSAVGCRLTIVLTDGRRLDERMEDCRLLSRSRPAVTGMAPGQ